MLLSEASDIRVGAARATAVYAGDVRVWPVESEFSPADLAGLTVWLDASQLGLADGAPMSSWPDLSGSGYHGAVVSSPSPKYRVNGLNGKGVVRTTVSEGRFRWTGLPITKDYTLVYVGRMASTIGGRVVCAAYPAGGNLLFGWWTTFEDIAYATGGAGFFVPDTRTAITTTWKMYSADCATPAVSPRLFSNGALLGSHPMPPAADGFGGTLNISGYGTSTEESCDSEVAELILYNRKLPDVERQQVEDYLRTKWGL